MTLDPKLRQQIERILGDPSLFPDSFKSWVPRQLQDNPGFRVIQSQLPAIDKVHDVDVFLGTTGEPQFLNSWVNFGSGNEPARFWKDPWNVVHLSGMVKAGAIGSAIFTLPGGYRPENLLLFAIISNGAFGALSVDPSGPVVPTIGNNTYVSLSGISFRAF